MTHKDTLHVAYLSYITQAIVNGLAPLLFVTFRETLGVGLAEISLLITLNFAVQMGMDVASTLFVDRIGYRASVILAALLSATGLILLGVLPTVFGLGFPGLLIATVTAAIGGGLLEVVVSPLVEALPLENKSSVMSFLHSFYSWGEAGVVLFSTLFFVLFGTERWYILVMLWAIIPLISVIGYLFVPIEKLLDGKEHVSFVKLLRRPLFYVFFLIMIAAGASEAAIAEWTSLFAETGLGVTKTVGDLLGVFLFAILMGTGRVFYAKCGHKIRLERWVFFCFALCVVSYLLTVFAPHPVLSLVGCAVAGFAVAPMWPGTYSLGSRLIPDGGTLMFALFALGGDVGCTVGPVVVGLISDALESDKLAFLSSIIASDSGNAGMKGGILIATLFPLLGLLSMTALINSRNKK